MSYFEDYERKLEEEEAEQAEIDASNEYQKELDENQIHIEKLADGSWVGKLEIDMVDIGFEELDNQMQKILDALLEQKEKDTTDTSTYVCKARVFENFSTGKTVLIVKLKKVKSNE